MTEEEREDVQIDTTKKLVKRLLDIHAQGVKLAVARNKTDARAMRWGAKAVMSELKRMVDEINRPWEEPLPRHVRGDFGFDGDKDDD